MVRNLLSLVVVFGLAGENVAQAAWPNLNPFSSGNKSGATNSWWPGTKTTARPSGPSTMTKLSNGTKSFVKKTGEVLNPWSKPVNETPQQTLRKSIANKSAAKKTESSSWWPTWGEEEPARPRTVGDFLKQDRPGFND